MIETKNIISHKGAAPRVYKNILVFLAPDKRALDNLKDAVRLSLAWSQIVKDRDTLNLTQGNLAIAESKMNETSNTFQIRMKETWSWILYPSQVSAHEEIEYSASKLSSQDRLFERIQKKLESDGAMYSTLGPNNFNQTLENYIWNDNSHLLTSDLIDYHCKNIYLQRLSDRAVLKQTILSSISQAVAGPFAYAESFDKHENKYIGLVIEGGINTPVALTNESVIVRSSIAEANRSQPIIVEPILPIEPQPGGANNNTGPTTESKPLPTKFIEFLPILL